jgi:hypothetical protein
LSLHACPRYQDLTQLSDPDFFAAVADDISLVVKNVARLQAGAAALGASKQMHPARVLSTVDEEEVAKVLILLDAVRCPRTPDERLAGQLARFNDHLAKGLYTRACGMRPGTLAELLQPGVACRCRRDLARQSRGTEDALQRYPGAERAHVADPRRARPPRRAAV